MERNVSSGREEGGAVPSHARFEGSAFGGGYDWQP